MLMKKILITGGFGFVGSHFVEHVLKNTDWDIVILDRLSYAADINRITDTSVFDPNRINFIYHDLRGSINESQHNRIGKLDYVIHFAAESHVDRSLEDAVPFAQSNVVGTTNLLQYLKEYQPELKKYIGFNTDEVFGPAPEGVFHSEDFKFKPSNPYAAAKCGQWAMEYSFAHAFKMPIMMVHSMNIISERQHPEKFFPMTIKKLSDGKKIILHGVDKNNQSSRCWIHARNVADALMFLLKKGETGETYNIVGEEKTIWQIADWICETVKGRGLRDSDVEWLDFHKARKGHDKRYALDGSKLSEMGWKPPKDLESSLKKAIKWCIKPENRHWLS